MRLPPIPICSAFGRECDAVPFTVILGNEIKLT